MRHSQNSMQGRELLKLLLKKQGLTPNGFVTRMNGRVKQPTLHKFLELGGRESRRSTLQPIADYFSIPIEAFYDDFLADKIAYQMGLIESSDISADTIATTGLAVREAGAPIPFPPSPATTPPNLRDALRRVRDALAHETPGIRRSVVAIMSDLADRAEDDHFSDQMIERIMGALGRQGNDVPPQSTPSESQAGGAK